MARNNPDNNRRTIIERNGRVIYTSDPAWPAPAACFTPDVQQLILAKTIRNNTDVCLCVTQNMQPAFWERVAECCRAFAHKSQDQAFPQPSTDDIRKAKLAADRLRIAMRPILGMYPDNDDVELLGKIQARIDVWEFAYRKRTTKQRNNAARVFIAEIGGMYCVAFGREPAETPEGPFARFVLACLEETKGLPHKVSPEWVRMYVQEHKNTASQRSNALWTLGEHLAWGNPL